MADSEAAPAKVALREMAEECHRELAWRHRSYPARVKDGKMSEAEAAVGIARMRAARDTLRILAPHENAVRNALRTALELERADAELAREIEAVRGHPAVQAVLAEFPDATIADVRRVARELQIEADARADEAGFDLEETF